MSTANRAIISLVAVLIVATALLPEAGAAPSADPARVRQQLGRYARKAPYVRKLVASSTDDAAPRFLDEAEIRFLNAIDLARADRWEEAAVQVDLASIQLRGAVATAQRGSSEQRQLAIARDDLDIVLYRARRAVADAHFDPVAAETLSRAEVARHRVREFTRHGRQQAAALAIADAREFAIIALEQAAAAPRIVRASVTPVAALSSLTP